MKLLKLVGLHLGPYKGTFVNKEFKETTVNAYVYYTKKVNDKDEACDDKGELIGTFMGDAQRSALEAMVKTKIKPTIDKGLGGTPYYVSVIDYTNMAPHPHLVIARRDNMPLAEDEVETIRQLVETAIDVKNLSVINAAGMRKNNIFESGTQDMAPKEAKKPAKRVAEDVPEPQQTQPSHYNLRKRH
jgi:hypothetical protein